MWVCSGLVLDDGSAAGVASVEPWCSGGTIHMQEGVMELLALTTPMGGCARNAQV